MNLIMFLLLLQVEHLVDRQVKEPRDPERQRERRQVTAALDRDHRLPRDAQGRRHFSLGQPSLGALLPDPVPHEVKVALHQTWCQATFTNWSGDMPEANRRDPGRGRAPPDITAASQQTAKPLSAPLALPLLADAADVSEMADTHASPRSE